MICDYISLPVVCHQKQFTEPYKNIKKYFNVSTVSNIFIYVPIVVLCMSNGDYRKQGQTRKKELYDACKILGISEENITILRYL